MLLRIMPATPLLPKSPLITSYQMVDTSFQSPFVGPCVDAHLANNVICAYLIVW